MSTKEKKTSIPPDKLALYNKLIETDPGIQRKGVTLPYTSYNGHMFTFLSPTGMLAIRLAEIERADFLKKYKTTLMEVHGTIMKEYVTVPEKLLKNTKELSKYLALSFDYIKSLKPKVAKKAKTSQSKKKAS